MSALDSLWGVLFGCGEEEAQGKPDGRLGEGALRTASPAYRPGRAEARGAASGKALLLGLTVICEVVIAFTPRRVWGC
jgi:hypothetical protein